MRQSNKHANQKPHPLFAGMTVWAIMRTARRAGKSRGEARLIALLEARRRRLSHV